MVNQSRRNFLKNTAKVFASGFLAGAWYLNRASNKCDEYETCGQGSLEEKVSKANEKLRSFPEQINGAGEVRKYEVEGAKYCLVHIAQTHNAPEGYKLPTREELYSGKVKFEDNGRILSLEESEILMKETYRNINNSQKDIYSIVRHLQKGEEPLEIMTEGVFKSDNLRFVNKGIARTYERELQNLEESGYFTKGKESYEFVPGAIFRLRREGRINCVPAEADVYKENRNPFSEEHDKEGREDSLLGLVNGDSKIVYTIYGSSHNFKNNIERWNAENPDKKFSLIEVIPKSNSERSKK